MPVSKKVISKKLKVKSGSPSGRKKSSVTLSPSNSLRVNSTKGIKPKRLYSSPTTPVQNDKRRISLSVPVYSLAGRASGTLSLPKEIFGQRVNEKLLAQALRVYMTNQKSHTASTKTRGEVRGSTAKIYRQKGTGRARHGAIRAPIFVGGGITFGPKPRKIRLDLPQKMKKAALYSALASKMVDREIVGVSGIKKASGKTKEMAEFLVKLRGKGKAERGKSESALIVTGEKIDNVVRGVRNIPGVDVLPANLMNAYEVLRHEMLLITKEAVGKMSSPKKEQK